MASKRGRKTAGELTAVKAKRPEPPDTLNENEARIWRETVSALPVQWFKPETLALLEAYCSSVDRYQRLSYRLDQDLETMEFNDIEKLTRVVEREGRFMLSVATKMRITQQSSYRAETTKNREPRKSSWANVAGDR